MVQQLKEIAKFSKDVIVMALNSLQVKEWQSFQQHLDTIVNRLGPKQRKES